jgi:hypothetical protein
MYCHPCLHLSSIVRLSLDSPSLACLFVRQLGYGTNSLLRLSRNGQGVHDKILFLRNTQCKREGVKRQSICILKERDPINSVGDPFLGNLVLVQKCMDITMSMGLGQYFVLVIGIKSNGGIDITEGGHAVALLDDSNATLLHAKIVVLLEQSYCPGICITRSHDAKRQIKMLRCHIVSFNSEYILNVILQVAFFRRKVNRQAKLKHWLGIGTTWHSIKGIFTYLESIVAQSFS